MRVFILLAFIYGRLGAVPSVLLLHLSKWKWCGANNVQTLSAESVLAHGDIVRGRTQIY
jgi:hypothetical protein